MVYQRQSHDKQGNLAAIQEIDIQTLGGGYGIPMIDFNWDVIEQVARETGRSIRLGVSSDFTKKEKKLISKEAAKRRMNVSMGNHKRNYDERDDEIYVTAKL